jgi:hypothetical protein
LAGAGIGERGEFGDVVDLHRAAGVAEFAPVPHEPGDDLFAGQEVPAGNAVVDDRGLAPGEGITIKRDHTLEQRRNHIG